VPLPDADNTPRRRRDRVAPGGIPPLDPTVYCTAEAHYRGISGEARPGDEAVLAQEGQDRNLNFRLSKVSKVSITVRKNGSVLYAKTMTLGYGNRSVKIKPSKSGPPR